MEELKPGQKIEKARIPDEDVVEWIKTLMEDEDNPFSAEEIDRMMAKLNFEYGRMKASGEVRNALNKTLQLIEKHPIYKSLTPNQQQLVRERALQIANQEIEKTKTRNTPKK